MTSDVMVGASRALPARRDLGGWPVIGAYTCVAAATQMLWLTFAAITTDSARRYGVSVGAIGVLSEIFPLLFVVLAIPAGHLLDVSFRRSLSAGAVLVAVGGLVRVIEITYAWALLGAVLVAAASPLILSAVSKLAGEYLAAPQRALGIGIGTAGNFAGMVAALALGPTVGAHGNLGRLLAVEAVLAALPTVALLVTLRRPGLEQPQAEQAIESSAARRLMRQPSMRILCGLMALGFGVFVALATWLQTLFHPAGVSDALAGGLLVAMVLAGVVGCAVLPAPIARRGAERGFFAVIVAVSTITCVVMGAVTAIGVRAAALVVLGLVLLPALPVVLTLAERIAGPAAGTAGALVWMAGNLGGLIVAVLVQVLVHHPLAAFLALAAVSLCGIPLLGRWVQPAPYDEAGA